MKFNFKKIASVLTSTVMLSSTIAFAAAANFPEPFVKSGVGSYAIVVGADANNADGAAATQLDNFLKEQITALDDSTSPITVDGESYMIADGDDMVNLGSAVTVVEDTLDSETEGLSNLLADGTYTNDAGDDFDYEQTIALSSDLVVDFNQDEDDNTYIGMDLVDGDTVLDYTLEFDTDAEGGAADASDEFPDLSDTYITMLGKEYYISDVEDSGSTVEMTLLDSANKVNLVKGESQTVTVGDKTYDLELTYVHSTNGIKVKVDGVETALLDQGETKKLADGTYLTVIENLAGEDADADSAVVSLGSGEIVLVGDGSTEVQVNGEDISDIDSYNDAVVTSTITEDGENVQSITLSWDLGDDTELKSGDELVLPGFGTVKVVMGDFVTPKEEVTSFENSGTKSLVLKTEVVDGDYTLPILYSEDETNFTATGKDANTILWSTTGASLNFTEANSFGDDYFVITRYGGDEAESYILTLDDIDEDNENKTTFKNLVSNKKYSVDQGDDVKIGDITLALDHANADLKTVNMSISAGTDTATFGAIATKEGLVIELPITSVVRNASDATIYDGYTLTAMEEDGKGDILQGGWFDIDVSVGADGVTVDGTNLSTEYPETDGSDTYLAYSPTELATKTSLDTSGDQSTLDITYHGEESYAQVYVAAGDATSSGGGSSSGSMVVTDTSDEFNSVKASKNLIVLGGSCVNRVAAKVLNVEAQYPLCGNAWESLTTVGAGEFLIQTVTSPYSDSKVAMLVAGYAQTDTANAASALEANDDIETVDGVRYLNSGTTLTKG